MTAQEYIDYKLNNLKDPTDSSDELADIEDEIYKKLTSKKYRKYALTPEFAKHIKGAINIRVNKKLPINITLTQGGYKLWSLGEAPYVDWAEFFANIRHIEWLKTICQIYQPGIEFEIFFDDALVPYICNLDFKTTEQYVESYKEMLNCLEKYTPDNFYYKITTLSSKFNYPEEYEAALSKNEQYILDSNGGNYPDISIRGASVKLNTKPLGSYAKDSEWQEKILLTHDAGLKTKNDLKYHLAPDKIHSFASKSPFAISVGATASSGVKYWTGVGALKRSNPYSMDVLSPKQLAAADFKWEDVNIKGLQGKNFNRIRVLN
jgi:hypothetical protein